MAYGRRARSCGYVLHFGGYFRHLCFDLYLSEQVTAVDFEGPIWMKGGSRAARDGLLIGLGQVQGA